MEMLQLFFLAAALLVCPALFVMLIIRMRKQDIVHPPFFAFFCLFGTVGGWFLALALSPSGLAAICCLFLATIAPLSLLGTSIYLAFRPERSVYHRIALWTGGTYAALCAALFLAGQVYQMISRR